MILKSETYNFHRLDLTRQAGFIVTTSTGRSEAGRTLSQRLSRLSRKPERSWTTKLRGREINSHDGGRVCRSRNQKNRHAAVSPKSDQVY